jgi:hypothetical protein
MRNFAATVALLAVGLLAAGPVMGGATPAATAARQTTPPAYPELLRERVSETHAKPRFETTGQGTVTWLQIDVGGGNLMWSWRNLPDDSSSEEWRRMPTLADAVTLDPNVEYTFDTVWLDDCDDLTIEYPFKADRSLLLRIRRGDAVIFDALEESARRSGRPLAAIVYARQPPTPAVVATLAAPAPDAVFSAVLQQMLDDRAYCESSAAFRLKWKEDEQRLTDYARFESAPAVMIAQPLWESSVVVLVNDPLAKGATSIEVSVLEGNCGDDFFEPGRTVRLDPVAYQSSLFMGRAEIEGAQGTAVKARYRRTGDSQHPAAFYESALVSMSFH